MSAACGAWRAKRLPVDTETLSLDTKPHPGNIGRNPAVKKPKEVPRTTRPADTTPRPDRRRIP
jgi:hypothetical protein